MGDSAILAATVLEDSETGQMIDLRSPGQVGDETRRDRELLRWLLLVVSLTIAMLPMVLAGKRALDEGWRPVADNPRLATDAAAFAAGRPPLLGARSTSLENATRVKPVHHLGPSEAWLLGSVQVVWAGPESLVVTAAALAAAAAAVIVLASSKIAGPWGGLAAGAVAGAVAGRLGTPILADIWNPYIPILPLAAAVVSAWAAALHRWRPGLPLAVLFGTIASQAHLTYVPLIAVAVAPGLALAWHDRLTRRRSVAPLVASEAAAGDESHRRWVHRAGPGLAVVIGLVLWFPTVLSEATAGHSNLGNVWRAATKDTGEVALGKRYGVVVFDRVVSRPPPFGPPASGAALWLVPTDLPFRVALTFALVLIPAVAVFLYGLRRRDRLMLLIGASVVGADLTAVGLLSVSTFSSGAALYQTRWLWSVAILHWGGIAIAAVHVFSQWSQKTRRPWRPAAGAVARGVLVVLAVGAAAGAVRPLPAAATIPPDERMRMDSIRELQAGLRDEVRRDGPTTFRVGSLVAPANAVALEVASALIAQGVDVKISSRDPALRKFFGGHHAAPAGDRGEMLLVTDRRLPPSVVGQGLSQVAATPRLSRDERRRLGQVTQQLRGELTASKVRWTEYGRFLHPGRALPDPDTLLRTNQLGLAIYSGQLSGRRPDPEPVRTFTDLQRRALPETTFVVWRRSSTG